MDEIRIKHEAESKEAQASSIDLVLIHVAVSNNSLGARQPQ